MMGSFRLILFTPDETDSQRIDQEEEKGETQDERHFLWNPWHIIQIYSESVTTIYIADLNVLFC
jgi:hypothetical protein